MQAGWLILGAAALIVGTALRVWQLDGQILIDDEWHAIHRLLAADIPQIVTRLGYADYSIPLTVAFRLLYDHGMLSERWMHIPAACAGIALLVAAPWLMRRSFALPVRMTWVALLAISPLLLYHSMVARPYAFTVLLTLIAVVAFRRFWHDGSRRAAAAYIFSTGLAGYLHAVTLPFVLMPLAYYGIAALRLRRRLVGCIVVGAITALLIAVTLGPPVVNDWQQFTAKAGKDHVTVESVYRSWLMLAGSRYAGVLAAIVALAIYGWWRVRRRDPGLARYLLAINGVAAIAVALSGATWIFHPLVYARYLIPGLPFLLLFVAEGAIGLVDRVPRVAPLMVAAGAALLYALGPIPAIAYYPNQFWGHLRFQYDYDPRENPYVTQVPKEPVPAFYRELAARPPASLTLIEMPWRLESNFDPHAWYQEVHRQRVMIGLVTPVCGTWSFGEYPETRTGLRMRHFAHLSALLRGQTYGADFLIVHVKPWKTPPDEQIEWPDMTACMPQIEARYGAPVWRGDGMVVYALKR